MIVKHIGARKGSKGVPYKNMADVCGRPLIDWSLAQLLRMENPGPVIVSTDCQDTLDHCVAQGAVDIGLRPDSLAGDDVSKWDVWKHSLEVAKTLSDEAITAFLDLDCTSPLRLQEDINGAIELFETKQPDMVMSCCIARKNPYFNLLETNEDGSLRLSKQPAQNVVARQQAPLVYEHAASTYVLDPSYLQEASSLYQGKVLPYVMPAERCHDIDCDLDLRIVQMLLSDKIANDDA